MTRRAVGDVPTIRCPPLIRVPMAVRRAIVGVPAGERPGRGSGWTTLLMGSICALGGAVAARGSSRIPVIVAPLACGTVGLPACASGTARSPLLPPLVAVRVAHGAPTVAVIGCPAPPVR